MPKEITSTQVNALLTDSDFLKLAQSRNRPNLFETLAASHIELWHSAFVKWLIDPQSHLGLGDFPLKRFLFTVLDEGTVKAQMPDLTIGDLETMDLNSMEFKNEFPLNELKKSKGSPPKVDIRGCSEKISLQLIIENKVKSLESKDQTQMYYDWAMGYTDFAHKIFVFLSVHNKEPSCANFIRITYQHLCDNVIKPCLNHPALPDESRYLLEQYLLNLGKRAKGTGGFVMADPNKELCQKIYDAHKEVLDEIYVSALTNAPQPPRSATKNPNITLAHLVNKGLLNISDQLFFTRHGITHTAELKRRDSGDVVIYHSGKDFKAASTAASAITNQNENGLDVWKVQGSEMTLNELKKQLAEQQNREPDEEEETEEDLSEDETAEVSEN